MNDVKLTDAELTLIATALQMQLLGFDEYLKKQLRKNEEVDQRTAVAIAEMKVLYDKLVKEYF